MLKRLLSVLLAAALLLGCFPAVAAPAAHAEETPQKTGVTEATFNALGFGLNQEFPDDRYLGPGNTTMLTQSELYLDINGSSHYGWILRQGLNLHNKNWTSYKSIGAYQLYFQYKNGDWADLDAKNGYTYGQTGGQSTVMGSDNEQGYHLSKAYETAEAYRTASGRKDRVAQLSVNVGTNRIDSSVRLEIVRFVENSDGTYGRRTVDTVKVNDAPVYALDEAGYFYNQYFDALFDIATGDFNGDGIDEIAVYYGANEVKIYETKYDDLTLWKTINFEKEGILKSNQPITTNISCDSKATGKARAAVVTLATGDLKRDYTDDLVITVSMPQGATEWAHKNYPNAYVYGTKTKKTVSAATEFKQDLKVQLTVDNLQGDKNKPQVFKAANAVIGDLDGDNRKELVIGGRLCSDTGLRDSSWSVGGMITVQYDPMSRAYVVGPVYQTSLNEYDDGDILRNSHNADLNYLAPAAMAIADLDGTGLNKANLLFFAELFTFKPSTRTFSGTGKYLDTIKNQTNNANEGVDKSQHWVSDVIVGNFNNNEDNAQQILAIIGCKESGSDWYYYYMSYMAQYGNDFCAQCEGIINQARSYLNQSSKSRATPYVSIACPDVDNDGMLLKFRDSEFIYTKPEVQAVLQSAPYFGDVAEVYDNYLNNGATAYGKAFGNGQGTTASIDQSYGGFLSVEVSAAAAASFELELGATINEEHATMQTTETSVEYAGSIGDDYVVMYTIPFTRYIYDAVYPDGTTGIFTIEEPLPAVTVIVPVETYDEVAAVTDGLEPIRGNILTSTPGDPASYREPPKGEWVTIGGVQMLTNAGANSGSTVTVSQTITDEVEDTYSVGFEESLKIGGGAGFGGFVDVVAGVTQGFAISEGEVSSKMEGVAYTGTVDNLPAGVSGYQFNWQFGISRTKLNGENIIVIGYTTDNVKQAPTMPSNLNVTDITDTDIVLEWGVSPDAALYEVFVSRDQDTWLPLDPIPATMAGDSNVLSYTVRELSPGTTYYFKVNAADSMGVRSLDTGAVLATTLGNEGAFSILTQPKDTSAAQGKDATFTIAVDSNSNATIYYQWMYQKDGKWVNISNSNASKLTIKNVTQDMDGRVYRCRVSQSANYFFSQGAKLTVSKSPTEIGLDVTNNGAVLADGSTVQASYTTTQDVVSQITVWNDVTQGNYTKVTLWEYVTEDENGYSYSSDAVYFWMDAEGKLYRDVNGSVGEKVPSSYIRFLGNSGEYVTSNATGTVEEVTVTKQTDETTQTTVGSTTTAYAPKDEGGSYVYVVKITDEDGKTSNGYFVHSGTDEIYETVSFDGDLFEVDGKVFATNDLTSVKHQTIEQIVTGQTTQTTAGDTLTLTASDLPADLDGSDKVYFQITSTASGSSISIPAAKSGDVWTAEYTFSAPGAYQIAAVYGGSDVYFASRSGSITVYAVGANASLSLNGGSMTYGNSLHLSPVLHSAKGAAVPSDVTYTVKKDNKVVEGLVSNGVFTPAESGNYMITASCKMDGTDYTASAEIKVHTRTLTITAESVKASLSDSEQARKDLLNASVSGLLSADAGLLSYELRSSATTAKFSGEYRIDINVLNRAALEKKYNLVLVSGIFTLDQSSVRVNAEAVANGAVTISYTTTVTDSNGTYTSTPLTVESGSLLPTGATVVLTASPNSGFGVEKWIINGLVNQSTDTTYVIDNLQSVQDIKVYFTQTYSTLNFSGTEGCGTVTGAYVGSNASFNSGDRINVNQSVVLTAQPAEGYVVSYWSCDGEIIKSANGQDNYTGLTCTVSGVSKTTTYFVAFEKEETVDVKINFADKDGYPILGAGVSINGQSITGDGSSFTFAAAKHENLTVELDVPESMLIDHWELNGKVVANAVEVLELYDVRENLEYTVYCTIPNQRVLNYGAELIDTNGGALENAGTVTASRSGSVLESGSNLPQGAIITLTAAPAEGYRIARWTLNGSVVAGTDVETYQFTLDQHSTVTVHFEKKPVISIEEGGNGSVNAQAGSTGIANGGFVEFGDDVQINITPDAGFVVDTVTVNGEDVTDQLRVSGDIRYHVIEDMERNTDVAVTYKAKPVITIDGGEYGSVTVEATKDFTCAEIDNGSYVDFGSALNITVDPDDGYIVKNVTVDGIEMDLTASEATDTVKCTVSDIQKDAEILVTYLAKPTVTVDEGEYGSVTVEATRDFANTTINSGSYVDFATDMNVTVAPAFGYVVDAVLVNGEKAVLSAVANSDDVTFVVANVQADTEIVVYYTAIDTAAVSFGIVDKNGSGNEGGLDGTITASVDRKGMDAYAVTDDASGRLTVYSGSTVTFIAVPDDGFKVSKWFVNGQLVSEQPVLVIEDYMADQLVEVQFDLIGEAITYATTGYADKAQLSATFTPAGGLEQSFASGNRPTIDGTVLLSVSNLDPNYEIEGWYVNGEKQEGQNGLTFAYDVVVDMGAEITVNLVRCSYQVTFSAAGGTVTAQAGEMSVASGDSLVGDTEITFTAIPRETTGYTFQYWMVNGNILEETAEELTIVLTEDVDVRAVYRLDYVRYTVTYGVVDTNGEENGGMNGTLNLQGSRYSPAQIRAGSNLTFTATPAANYRVEGWYADAEGTMAIDGTTLEQLVYSTENLVCDMTVYVKFEPIPEYTIDLTVTGMGTVTAAVNGVSAEIVDGKLTVQRYDDVVLTAIPEDDHYLNGWTLDGEAAGNAFTLTFTDVIADAQVAAEFLSSQSVILKTDVVNGEIHIEAGFGENLEQIEPGTGIAIEKGQKVVLTVEPHEGKMLDKWIINGEEIDDYLSHTYVIENIDRNTDVQVLFIDEVLHSIPESEDGRYTITEINETPERYGSDLEIRDRGAVSFRLEGVAPFVVSALTVDAGEGSTSQVVDNGDGSWTVIIENVKADIAFDITYARCCYRTEETLSSGTYILTLGGKEVGAYTFAQMDEGWSIQAADGTYLALQNMALAYTDEAYAWTYSDGRFSTTIMPSGNSWWGSGSVTYYLASSGTDVTASIFSGSSNAAFLLDHEDELHTFDSVVTEPTCTEDGFTTNTCVNCGYAYTSDPTGALGHSYENGSCTRCGEEDPDYIEPTVNPVVDINGATLSFEDEIHVNFYYTVSDMTDVTEQGLLVFNTDPGETDFGKADTVYTGFDYVANSGHYVNSTDGIAAKEMGDDRYYCAYVKLSDGTYVYSELAQYSPKKYAMNMLGSEKATQKQKVLCVAMLNYGAAAQEYFNYRTDDLMNAGLTAEQQAMVKAYDASYFKGAVKADTGKLGSFAATETGFSLRVASVSFEGAFAINYYVKPDAVVAGDLKLYVWTLEDYAAADVLTAENVSDVVSMEAQGDGSYWAQVSGIAAKKLDEPHYVAAVYTDANGNTYCTGVVAYSLSEYCVNNANGKMGALAQATAMYGYYAAQYFAN